MGRHGLSLPGLWAATALAFLSFTPSLLPRGVAYQGLVAGVVAAIGYGLGVLVTAVVRELGDRAVGVWSPRAWRVWWIWLGVGTVVSLIAGHVWHRQSSALVGLEPVSPWAVPLSPVVAVAVFALLLAVGRGLRGITRHTARWLERRTSARAARVISTGAVVVATALVFSGVLLDGIVATVDRSASVGDLLTPDGVTRPTTPLRSGSPESLVDWDELGREGRVFVGRGPTAEDITALTGEPAEEPVRIFAGVASAEDERERAELAAADLERAGGFERERLLVVTTTGTGWVEPSVATSFEYLADGDSAIVGMQYSHLPSPLSYWVDEERARDAGRALFDAVYARLAAIPAEDRPELYAFGESLGSFGGEAAFSGSGDMATRLDGALFVGPPRFNPLYRELLASRDPGSPEIEADYRDGETIRFTLDARRPAPPEDAPWSGSHILYFQHASDPVTWWSPDLILQRPDWLEEERGPDVSASMVWIPFVTFGQVSADLALGFGTPPGTGHIFSGRHAYAWDQVLGTNWPREQLDALSELTTRRSDP
ncbi:alpha/beta-hydrolase family protein [uncultured Nocardioides sp.]|uniref:alpha/beta hydrolase n=1 Tax=uncultured Nocardioides sp. TaxID=198441 RepID=UPI00262EFDCA|nr:alpha/beta-hydrolase family protein [uncultured Nocardioides sp.]